MPVSTLIVSKTPIPQSSIVRFLLDYANIEYQLEVRKDFNVKTMLRLPGA